VSFLWSVVWRRWRGPLLCLVLAAGAGCGSGASTTTTTATPASTHIAGDPGGRILAELRDVAGAVPTTARVSWRHLDEPVRDSCDGEAGTWGYDPVTVEFEFTVAWSGGVVLGSVRRVLEGDGWKWTEPTPVSFPGQDYGSYDAAGTWARTLAGGRPATAALTHGASGWHLIAEAPATLPPPKPC